MEWNQIPPAVSASSDAELTEKISDFWRIVQSRDADDPINILQEASKIWGNPILARLPDTDGSFYFHHGCSPEECRQIMNFLDEQIELLPSDGALVSGFQDTLPDALRQRYPGGVICCQLVQEDVTTGYLALGGLRPLSALDNMFLLNLRGVLTMQFSSDQYAAINKKISNSLLFRAMLEGKSTDLDLSPVRQFIEKLPASDIWQCHIMLVNCNTTSYNRMQFLRETCNTMVTCSMRAIYRGQIVMLYHGRSKYPVQEHHVFTEYLHSNGLQCSISRGFTALEDVPKYYAQARAAMELGPKIAPGSVVHTYEKCAPFHVIQLAAKSIGIDELQSPNLLLLRAYDREKGTDLLKTLRIYLDNLNDVSAAATKLNIHRNTLFHRLRKIEEITQWNLSDGKNLDDIFWFFPAGFGRNGLPLSASYSL